MNTQTVLVVEDDDFAREYLMLVLKGMELDPVGARSAQAALEYLKESRPDLILLDINMPGMTGMDLLKLIRKQLGPKPPVIMTTASGDPADVRHALDLGADGYVLKPVQADLLRSRIARFVRLPGAQAAADHTSAYLLDDDLRRFRRR